LPFSWGARMFESPHTLVLCPERFAHHSSKKADPIPFTIPTSSFPLPALAGASYPKESAKTPGKAIRQDA
jgi:hypothetical protein